MIYKSIDELIGNTPLIEINNIEKELNLKSKILVKFEALNPTGSIKDRTALYLIKDGEEKGILKKGSTIIEPSSGNTGIGLAALGTIRGYKVILTIPSNMSKERIAILKAYGADVVLTDASKGMKGAIDKANELNKKIPDSYIPSQFSNEANPKAHYLTTGPEIYNDTDGNIDYFIASIGTGGTLTGTGKYLKEHIPNLKIFAVEPFNSPLLTKGTTGVHKIQGIGPNFVPDTLDKNIYDEVIDISDDDAFKYAKLLIKKEALFVGISSGAAIKCAIDIATKEENKVIVAILPDSADRYYSSELFMG